MAQEVDESSTLTLEGASLGLEEEPRRVVPALRSKVILGLLVCTRTDLFGNDGQSRM